MIRRGQRDHCWCGGSLLDFPWHPSYGECSKCRCYVNRRPLVEEDVERLYSFDLYWHGLQILKGFPTIEGRSSHDRRDGRVGRWLQVIEQYSAPRSRVIEVGCGHGVLLAELRKRGYECTGVEVDEKVAAWTHSHTRVDVRAGVFPGVKLEPCDLFVAFDVLEHCAQPDEFMREAARLVGPHGTAIIQTPIDRYVSERPFGRLFDQVFDDLEHLCLFSVEGIHKLAEVSGWEIASEAHGVMDIDISVFRRKQA